MSTSAALLSNHEEFLSKTEEAFKTYDKDQSSTLNNQELKEILTSFASLFNTPLPDEEMVIELISLFDADQDGQLNLEEFRILIKELLEQANDSRLDLEY